MDSASRCSDLRMMTSITVDSLHVIKTLLQRYCACTVQSKRTGIVTTVKDPFYLYYTASPDTRTLDAPWHHMACGQTYMCARACMRACVHACMRACVHTNIRCPMASHGVRANVCVRACVHACRACTRACAHVCCPPLWVWVRARECVCVCARVRALVLASGLLLVAAAIPGHFLAPQQHASDLPW